MKLPIAELTGGHTDPYAAMLLELAVIVAAAMFGRFLARKLKQPGVLGELLMGVLIGTALAALRNPLYAVLTEIGRASQLCQTAITGSLSAAQAAPKVFTAEELAPGGIGQRVVEALSGPDAIPTMTVAVGLSIFSQLGIILLLMMVGLESSVEEMVKVGFRSTLVAIVGVIAPFALGYWAGTLMLPNAPYASHLFLGATLSATSIGITARVFKDLKCLQTVVARVVVGAAVIDDVIGLIILAVVTGVVTTGSFDPLSVLRTTALATLFLGSLMYFGDRIVRFQQRIFHRLDQAGSRLLSPLGLAFALSWLASIIHLAPIVGAFAAGLILKDEHFRTGDEDESNLESRIAPVESVFAPVFFVLMGTQANLQTLVQPETLALAGILTLAAIVGKLAAGLVAGRGVDRLTAGIGMIPRGEVGLVFAGVGRGLGVVSGEAFSAVVAMVMVTTIVTPIGLKWSLGRRGATVSGPPA